MALLIALVQAAAVASDDLPEYVLKAGFLFNFAKYVEWPADAFDGPEAPLRVGVVGKDPFGGKLEKALKGRSVRNRPFVVERFAGPDELRFCHLLFVPRTETPRREKILEKTRAWPTISVGEEEGFARAGGVVGILIVDQKPRLELNTDAAARARLTVDARLIKLADVVKEGN